MIKIIMTGNITEKAGWELVLMLLLVIKMTIPEMKEIIAEKNSVLAIITVVLGSQIIHKDRNLEQEHKLQMLW